MSVLAPIWLGVAALVGVGLVIAHLFSTSVPPRDYLPTVRFVPEGAPLAVMRTRRLSDIGLLLLRLLAVALLGLALAGAYMKRSGPARVVIVDASRAVASFAESRDSAIARADDAVIVIMDSVSRIVSRDSLTQLSGTSARGSLSAALVAAHRALANVSDSREKIELVVVSPAVREQVDSATAPLISMWEGPVRHIRVAAATEPAPGRVAVVATGDDPVAASRVIPGPARDLQFAVRVVRASPTAADSTWARDAGGALVLWPSDQATTILARRATTDTVDGVAAGTAVVVASFERSHVPRSGRVIARWIDGEAAATEVALGKGCVREVAVPVDPVGDLALRESFGGLVSTLTEPCGGAANFTAATMSFATDSSSQSGESPQTLRSAQDDKRLAIVLAVLALLALVAEQFMRTRARAAA